MLCHHCGGVGHVKETCFYIKGYPEWHRSFGQKLDPSKMPKYQKGKSLVTIGVFYDQPISQEAATGLVAHSIAAASGINAEKYQLLHQALTQHSSTSSHIGGLTHQAREGDWKI